MLPLVSTGVCLLSHCHGATRTKSDHTVVNRKQENDTERGRCDVTLHHGCHGDASTQLASQQDLRGCNVGVELLSWNMAEINNKTTCGPNKQLFNPLLEWKHLFRAHFAPIQIQVWDSALPLCGSQQLILMDSFRHRFVSPSAPPK